MEDLNVVETPKPPISPIALISLVSLTAFSFILSVYLGYQSIQLRNEIERLKTQVTVVPSPTPAADPTANWKTYVNNSFGFSVKYNPAFNPNEIAGSVQQLALISFGSMKNNGFEVEISTGDNIEYYKNRVIDQGEKIEKEEKVVVDGISATKLTYKQVLVIDKFDVSKVIVTKNNRDYIITALASDINQILSTFKFTEKADTSNWEVFQMPGIYYYFKYPKNLEFGGANEWSTFSLESKEILRFVYNGNKSNETLVHFVDNYQEFFRGPNPIHWGPRAAIKIGELNGFEVDEPEFDNVYTFLQHPMGKGFMIFARKKGTSETEALVRSIINTSAYVQ